MNINQLRGGSNFNAQLPGAVRGGAMAGTRQKKKTFAQKLGGFAKGVANVGLQVAGAAIPGGGILKNAIGGALSGLGGSNTGGTAGLNGQGLLDNMMSQNMEFLALQQGFNSETRKYNTISNAIKAAHDAAMTSIRNMK